MKHKEKAKYGIRQSLRFMLSIAWEKRRRVLLICLVIAALQIALNLAQLYVTPEILTRVENGASVLELIKTIGLF